MRLKKRDKNKKQNGLREKNPLLNVAKNILNKINVFHNKNIMKVMLFGNNMNKWIYLRCIYLKRTLQ